MPRSTARSIACEALRRGILQPEDVWDLANRASTAEGKVPVAQLLSRSLDQPTLAALEESVKDARPTALLPPGEVVRARSSSRPPVIPSSPPASTYELREVIGSGGRGVVHAASERWTGRTVALKTLRVGRAADARTRRAFLEEARITARLEHPSIVPVYDMGMLPGGEPYYTMRIVERRSLRDVLRRPELRAEWPLARLLAVLVQVLRALAYAHARGYVHCDIKPSNILLGTYGEVYVADWGLAKAVGAHVPSLDAATKPRGASSTLFAGTPGYMAPEQCGLGDGTVDPRTDIFALGVVLYEVLTGARPFRGKKILRSATDEPRPPRERKPDCPVLLDELCMQMLSKDKEARPVTAGLVALELEAFLEGTRVKEHGSQTRLRRRAARARSR